MCRKLQQRLWQGIRHLYLHIVNCRVLVFKKKLVLPPDDIGKSLYTFLQDGYIPENLLSNTNPNNWGEIYYSFNKYYIATVTKLVLAAWKCVIVVTIGLMKFAKILIVKIKYLKLTAKKMVLPLLHRHSPTSLWNNW